MKIYSVRDISPDLKYRKKQCEWGKEGKDMQMLYDEKGALYSIFFNM